MSSLTTNRPINIDQLDRELGRVGVYGSFDGATWSLIADNVSQATLQAAVDAHVAIDESGNRTTLENQAVSAMTNNRTYLALTNPTAAQTTAQVKALTRQMNALIRVVFNRLDNTD